MRISLAMVRSGWVAFMVVAGAVVAATAAEPPALKLGRFIQFTAPAPGKGSCFLELSPPRRARVLAGTDDLWFEAYYAQQVTEPVNNQFYRVSDELRAAIGHLSGPAAATELLAPGLPAPSIFGDYVPERFGVLGRDVFSIVDGSHVLRTTPQGTNVFTVPEGSAGSLWVVDGRVLLLSGSALLELNAQTGGTTVLASRRRQPQANVLDAAGDLSRAMVFAAPDGVLCVYAPPTLYRFDPKRNDWSASTPLPRPDPNAAYETSSEGSRLGYGQVVMNPPGVLTRFPGGLLQLQGVNCYQIGPARVGTPLVADATYKPFVSDEPRWRFPDELRARAMVQCAYAWDNGSLWCFVVRKSFADKITRHHLVRFDTRWEKPLVTQLELPMAPGTNTNYLPPIGSDPWHNPSFELAANAHGLGIFLPQGVWWLEGKALRTWVTAEAARLGLGKTSTAPATTARPVALKEDVKPTNRVALAKWVFKKYDRNHDGALDGAELEDMRDNKADWLAYAGPTYSSRSPQAVLQMFDRNGDGKLDENEDPQRARPQLLPEQRQYDLNHDGRLDTNEIAIMKRAKQAEPKAKE